MSSRRYIKKSSKLANRTSKNIFSSKLKDKEQVMVEILEISYMILLLGYIVIFRNFLVNFHKDKYKLKNKNARVALFILIVTGIILVIAGVGIFDNIDHFGTMLFLASFVSFLVKEVLNIFSKKKERKWN